MIEQMSCAYLVLVLNVAVSPPRIVGVDIFSEPGPTMRSGFFPIVITEYRSLEGYGDAKQRLLKQIEQPLYEWVKPLFAKRKVVFVQNALA